MNSMVMRLLAGIALSWTLTAPSIAAEPLKVVASFSIIADMARNVGGDRVEVTALVGPNGDTHAYEPRPADAATVARADVVLVNGAGLEGFLPRLVKASGSRAPVVTLTDGVQLLPMPGEPGHDEAAEAAGHDDHDHDHDAHAHNDDAHEDHAHGDHGHEGHDHGAFDPHAWQSVANAKVYVSNIADAFCAADAAGCPTYRANAASYAQQLEALDREVRAAMSAIPADKRTIITSHDAFGYFAHAYGLTLLAPEGAAKEAEASAGGVAKLIRQIRDRKASAIFVENVTNPNLMKRIASETGLVVGGELYSDALSEKGGPAATYVDMIRHNLSTIRGAILGS